MGRLEKEASEPVAVSYNCDWVVGVVGFGIEPGFLCGILIDSEH
jgi:hypothetical protein